MRRRRRRRQHVILRPKQREELTRRLRSLGIALAALCFAAVFVRMISRDTSWAPNFVRRHTPVLVIQAPATLADMPLLKQPPKAQFSWWVPGVAAKAGRQWVRENPAVRAVRFEKRYFEKKIIARLEPRIPLVRWEDRGIDGDGVVFKLASQNWTGLPKAVIPPQPSWEEFGRWLTELFRTHQLWNKIAVVGQGPRGEMWLTTVTGTRVAWGGLDSREAHEKARCLAIVLQDASDRLSGAAIADARFFEEGRVIVRPKSVSSRNYPPKPSAPKTAHRSEA